MVGQPLHSILFWVYETQTLEDTLKVKKAPDEQQVMDNYEFPRDNVLFHETRHWLSLVAKPKTNDEAYGTEESWDLVKDQGSKKAYVNPDSYTLDAVAILVHQHFKG